MTNLLLAADRQYVSDEHSQSPIVDRPCGTSTCGTAFAEDRGGNQWLSTATGVASCLSDQFRPMRLEPAVAQSRCCRRRIAWRIETVANYLANSVQRASHSSRSVWRTSEVKMTQSSCNSTRSCEIRPRESRNRDATTYVASPTASNSAIRRLRRGSDASQSQESTRIAAICAGVAFRSSTRTSRQHLSSLSQ